MTPVRLAMTILWLDQVYAVSWIYSNYNFMTMMFVVPSNTPGTDLSYSDSETRVKEV